MKFLLVVIGFMMVSGCSWHGTRVGAQVSPHGTAVGVNGKTKDGDIKVSDIPKTEHPLSNSKGAGKS